MAGLRKKQRMTLLAVGGALLIGAAVLVGVGLQSSIAFFVTPTQIAMGNVEPGQSLQLGGLVADGSVRNEGETVVFDVIDGAGETIGVRFTGVLPDLFREGQGVVARGELTDGVFIADEILAKHDETYMPREVVDALKETGEWREGRQ